MIIMDNFLLILCKNICCDPSSEPSRRDSSDEGSQRRVSMRNKKIIIKYSLLPTALLQGRQKNRIKSQLHSQFCLHILCA